MSDISRSRSWLFYGRAGTGKTTLAASFPGPALLIDIRDEGTDSVADVEDLEVVEVNSTEEFEELYWWLVSNPGRFNSIILDTVTQLQGIKVDEIGGAKAAKANKKAGDWGTLRKQDWGEIAAWMKVWLTNYRNLDAEVVFLAQDRLFNTADEDDEAPELDPEYGPRLSPSVMSHLCADVSVIGNTFIRDKEVKNRKTGKTRRLTEYCIRLGPSPSHITKMRKPKRVELPAFVSDADYEDLVAIIKGEE